MNFYDKDTLWVISTSFLNASIVNGEVLLDAISNLIDDGYNANDIIIFRIDDREKYKIRTKVEVAYDYDS